MKIKTLLVCFLTVAAISLTSCKKENYAEIPEDFVGMCCYSPEESFVREEAFCF